ncbi:MULTISPECIES: protein adenylyltransferase SelO [unclassified Prochlorococcus]|uniref:protein adenylyltransferase SelO n=1 Tax=unclassified Prochlorococcus TaxID=2627481 RepID=UPI00053394EB|nr:MULTISPECIES: protein adenylyltransferase SelO family protein [unclassified Prochlorococcus]KGG25830.1 Selenoprotein O-like [Prochlorococcus sp. MIT 0701]KGG26849.1 Selenoprotein O-like [Prochlorococcus sp. MIT 0702]KGG36124.1 Selenoprotein O-like [Prochlorococcus sp. MIT 0703]
MSHPSESSAAPCITTVDEFEKLADYSLMDSLNTDPDARVDGDDHLARQVFSGHFVPVTPTPLKNPEYVTHSSTFFNELGLNNELAFNEKFCKLFSGDLSTTREPMRQVGWATGYALSIYGREYTQQCPFGTGNGYGDGRAISVFEGIINGKRWEMQLKGGGPTPYCRGADGRAVLRSSVREFLAQEYMQALGVPTSRSLTLYVSKSETITRPWYSQDSQSTDPDILVENPVAISTRVAPSFLRVGQLELFSRRARSNTHPRALEELRMIVSHLIEREYKNNINQNLAFAVQLVELARLFRDRLTLLVANWQRVGYCQGNFNSDNCAAGGFTLDYGPFGFCEIFDPAFQPWTGGGEHFSYFNQPIAAEANYHMFWKALRPLLEEDAKALKEFDQVRDGFEQAMDKQIQKMWAAKLGLKEYNSNLLEELSQLMINSKVDYTIFFRELSHIPNDLSALKKSFYIQTSQQIDEQWQSWLQSWRDIVLNNGNSTETSKKMKLTNPKYTWREWLIAPAYQQAEEGNYSLVKELQEVLSHPYDEQSKEIEDKYYRLKPKVFFNAGGISHYSCSS